MSEAGDNTMIHVDEANAPDRRLEAVAEMKVAELKDALKQRKLKTSGNKKELRNRLRAAITLEIEHGEESDVEESDESDDDSDDSENQARCLRNRMYAMTFKDVEESMTTFSGDDRVNVNTWLKEFEEMASMCKWVDVQKIIYAKRLLRGSAKLFVNYEQCCKSWLQMKKALTREFSRVVDAHKIHRELARKTKRTNETYHEYIYEMFEIAKQVDMDTSSVIKYIIAGIPDDERNKTVLYGAKNIHELKEKFEMYETMKENMRPSSKRFDEQPKRMSRGGPAEEVVRRCFLCGGKDHLSSSCPTKSQGAKCFECREFGHIASNCPKKLPAEKKESCTISVFQPASKRYCKNVTINEHQIKALIDTGSDLCLMRADKYILLGSPHLQRREIRFRGIGSDNNRTLGEFSANVTIDGNMYPIIVRVVSGSLMEHEMIIGTDFLDKVTMTISGGKISIAKFEDASERVDTIPESLYVDCEVNQVDVSYIADRNSRETIKKLVDNHNAIKTREVIVGMNRILRHDESVYKREVVNFQVGERQRKGTEQPVVECTGTPVSETQNVTRLDDVKLANEINVIENTCEMVVDDIELANETDSLEDVCEIVVDDAKLANDKRTMKNAKERCKRVKVLDVNSRKEKVRKAEEEIKLSVGSDEEGKQTTETKGKIAKLHVENRKTFNKARKKD